MALSRGPGQRRRRVRRAPGRRAPVLAPETVTTDHGGPCKSHLVVSAQKALGCNILPARVLRPQDKAACERASGALRSLLFEHRPGYTGIDVADRGADPEAAAVLTMEQMERLVAEWIIQVWQVRAPGEHCLRRQRRASQALRGGGSHLGLDGVAKLIILRRSTISVGCLIP